MKKAAVSISAALLSLFAAPAFAENYELTVTRKGSNVYKVDSKSIIVRTRYCYVYAYSEEAILKWNGYGGELIFFDSKDKCDVKGAYGETQQNPGKFAIKATREDDDWYSVFGTDLFIRTNGCFSLAMSEDSLLTIGPGGYGRLRFNNSGDCMVEGVYSKLRLQ
ncbi:MAG: hypothetical protein HY856_13935 [Burkholderiales bacterium]|nr:hypothetical protein [Burkholderiales bacterium]